MIGTSSRRGRHVVAGALLLTAALAGCGSSRGSEGSGDVAAVTEPATSADTAPSGQDTTTTAAEGPTTTAAALDQLPDCQDLLTQYSAAFDPDDLSEVIALFRSWAPLMPEEVGAATLRLADAYEAADANLGNIDMADVDLSAQAQVFSDWTNEGCPPG